MSYQINFGNLAVAKSRPPAQHTRTFRIALMGDFSGRANRGELEVGEALAARKPLKVDCDNLDEVIARLGLKLALPMGDGAQEIAIASLDDLHPDQLYASLPIFSELAGLRQRLKTQSTFAKAAAEVQAWTGEASAETPAGGGAARGQTVPVAGKLSDFAQLVGRPSAAVQTEVTIADLIKKIVAPHIVPTEDPRQEVLVSAVDQALTAMMREVLHHPDFQALESVWRSVDFLVRRLETDVHLQIVLLDVSAEELVADVSREDGLENSALHRMLVEQPAHDAHQGPYSLIVGNYIFDHTPPHAEVLGRLAKIAAQAEAPFVSAIAPSCMDVKPGDVHPLIQEAWAALRARPEAAYVGLTLPRFLLRLPYGAKTEPIDSFDFEEFAPHIGLRGMLWGNSALLSAALLGASFSQHGAKMTARASLGLGDLPFYYYTDQDGDQIALPCTERLITSRVASALQAQSFIPVLAIKGRPEIRFAGLQSLAGKDLAGWWAPPGAPPPRKEEATPAEPEGETALPTDDSGDAGSLDDLLASIAQEATPTPEGETASDLEKLLQDLG